MKDRTKVTTAGRNPDKQFGAINPPVVHASTIVHPTVKELRERGGRPGKQLTYGLHGTPTSFALEEAITELEEGFDTQLYCSGLAAITIPLMAFLKAGDHLLMPDSVYSPSRRFCDSVLLRNNIETTYYDPLTGPSIERLIRKNTKVVFLESPGSLTFEIQDVPLLSEIAHKNDCTVMMDNAWATALNFKPLDHGVDVSVQPITKYISGHSDVMLGSATATEQAWQKLNQTYIDFGMGVSPDDVYLALRGLRTMAVRLKQHQDSAIQVASWLLKQPQVDKILHPAFETCPGHELWKRDFKGSTGLFSFVLKPCSDESLMKMLDEMKYFKMGYSWGGYESLILPADLNKIRTSTDRNYAGPIVRIHIGLEDVEDLIEDLEAGLKKLK